MSDAIMVVVCDMCGETNIRCIKCGEGLQLFDGTHDCSPAGHTCSSCVGDA